MIFRPYSKYTTRWSDQYQKGLVPAWNDPSQMNGILDKLAADMNALLKQEYRRGQKRQADGSAR